MENQLRWIRLSLAAIVLWSVAGIAWAQQAPDSLKWRTLLSVQTPAGQDTMVVRTAPEFYRLFLMVNTTNAPVKISGLSVANLVQLETGDTSVVVMRVNGRPHNATTDIALDPGNLARLELRAQISEVGNWFYLVTGKVSTTTKDTTLTYPLFMPGNVQQSVKPVTSKEPPFFILSEVSTVNSSWGVPTLRLTLRDTSGEGGSLNLPQVTLHRDLGEGASEQAKYKRVSFWTETGEEVKDIKIGPDRDMVVLARFEELRKPGKYEGKVVLSNPGMVTVEQPYDINIRSNAIWAILIILTGVLGGYWLNRVLSQTKPRLQLAQQVAQLAKDYADLPQELGNMDDEERRTLSSLQSQLSRLSNQLQATIPDGAEDMLKLLNAKLPLFIEWVKADRLVETVQPASLVTPDILALVSGALDYLLNPGADPTLANTQIANLGGISGKVESLINTNMTTQVAALRELATAHAEDLGSAYTSLSNQIDSLQKDVTAGSLSMEQMQVRYDSIRKDLSAALASELRTQAAASPVEGVAQEDWNKVEQAMKASVDKVITASTADDAVSAYHAACSVYLTNVWGVLKGLVEKRLAASGLDDATKATLQGILDGETSLTAAIAAGNLDDAKKLLDAAISQYNALGVAVDPEPTRGPADRVKALAAVLQGGQGMAGIVRMNVGGGGSYRRTTGINSREQMAMRSLADINRQLRNTDMISTVVIAILSTLVGMLTLYLPDNTWGGWEDYIYGLLWGFGLHTVTKSTDFGGSVFSYLAGKVSSPSTAPATGGGGGDPTAGA